MPIFSQIRAKKRNDTPLKMKGLDRFFAGKNFMAVDRQACSRAICLKICENLLKYYLGKVNEFEKHRMIRSALKNAFSIVRAYMPPLPRKFSDLNDIW